MHNINPAILHISSLQNPQVKQILGLRDRPKRDDQGLFLIEGYRELFRALEGKQSIQTLDTCSDLFLGSNEFALIEKAVSRGTRLVTCSEQVFRKLSYRDRPDGLLGVARQNKMRLSDLNSIFTNKPHPLFVIAEAIEKPGNLGTILRSSDAVGADAVIVCDRCTDIFNPNVVRASVGTLFTLPVVEATTDETLKWLKEHHVALLAATPSAKANYTDVDMCRPLAIAVGTEQLGLSERWMRESELQVAIPMRGVADSLNVAMATTLLLYEALRQRGQG